MTGEVPVGCGAMRGSIVVHAPDQGHAMNLFGEQGQVLADMVARDGRGNRSEGTLDVAARIRLEIKAVNMAQATPGKDDDTALSLAESASLMGPDGIGSL
tara:strand:+ start:518 stop:817 length:300 start_codon:yes stop_codon:yes gene_type:complete